MSYSTKNTGSKIPNEDILAQLRMIAPRNDPKQKDDYDVSDARFAELKIKNTENMIGTTIDEIPDKINSIKLNWVDEQQLYDDVLRDSRCLTRSTPDIIFTRLSEIYKHDIFNCVVRIYKHAPSFFTKTIMNPHQFKAFQKYFMLIEYINFINNTQDDVEISSIKDIDQIRQWVQVRHDNNIQYVINGPNNAGDGYNVKYVDKYNGLMSGSASIDDIAQSQMLTTQQNISSDLNKFLKEFREQHNAYDKLSDEARKYSINISSIKDVRIYKDEDILYFDMRGVDLGEVRDEVTETNYFTAEYEEKREITSMTNTMKLEEIMKFYSRIAIKELIIDPSLYVTNLASLSKVYIVFKGVVANERHISNVFKESDLKIPGHFIRTDRGFEFIPDTDVITYKSQMVNVRNFEMYITTGNPDDKIISNEYALTFDKNSVYNYPVEIYKDNDFSLKMQLLTDEHEEEQIVKYNLHNIEMPYLTTKVIDDLFSGMTGDWSLLLESFIDQWRKVDTKDMIIQNLWTYLGSIFIDVRNAITKKREMEVFKDNDYTSPAEIAVIENATWDDDVKEEMIQTLKQNNRIQYTKLSILTNTFDVIGWKSVVKQLCNIADINWEIMKGTTNQKKIEEGIELLKKVGLSHMTKEEIDNGKNTLYKEKKYIFAKKLSKGWAPINIDGAKWYFSTARDDNNKARLYMTSGTTKLVVANGMKINGNPYNVSKDTYGLKFWKQNDTNGYTWIVNNLEQQVGNANNETVSQYFYSLIGCAENNVKSAVIGYTNTAIDDTEASTTKRDVELAILVWGDVYRALKSMLENISGILKGGVVKKGTLEWKDVDLFYGTIDGKYFTYDNSKGGQYVKFIDYLDNNFRIYTKDQADLCLYNLMTIMNDGSFENNVYGSFMYSEYQQTIQNLKFVYPSSEINQNGALIRYTFDNFYDVDYEDIFGNIESLKLYPIEYTVEDVENKNVDNWYMLEYTQNKHYTSDFDNMTYYIKTNANAIIESMLMEVPVINKMSKIYPLNHVVMLDNDRKTLAEFEIFDETATVNGTIYDVKYENNALCLKSADKVVYELKLLSQYFEYEDDVWFITFVKDAFMMIGGLVLRSVIENENSKNVCYMMADDNKTVNIGGSDYNIIVDDTGIMFVNEVNANTVKVELNAKSVCLNEVVYDMVLYDTVNVELHSKVDEQTQYYYNIANKCYIGKSSIYDFDFEYDDKHFDVYIKNKRVATSKCYYDNDDNIYEYTISANDVNLPDEYISYIPFKTYDSIYDNRPLFEIFGNSLTLQHIINKTNESSKYYEIKAGSRQIKLNLFYYEKVKTEAYVDHAWKLFINRDDTSFEDMELETKLGGHIKIANKGNMFEVDVNIPGMEFNPNKPQEYVTFQESSQDKNYNINVYKVYYNPTDADYTFSDGTVVGKKLLRIDYCVQEKCLVAVCDVLRKEDEFELAMPTWGNSISVRSSDADKKYDIVSYMVDNTWRISTGLAFPLKTDFTNKSDDIYYSLKGSIEQSFDIVIDGSKLKYLVYSNGSVTIGEEIKIKDVFSWPADAINDDVKKTYLSKLPGKRIYVGSVVDDEDGNKVYDDAGLVTLKGNLYYLTSDSYDLNKDELYTFDNEDVFDHEDEPVARLYNYNLSINEGESVIDILKQKTDWEYLRLMRKINGEWNVEGNDVKIRGSDNKLYNVAFQYNSYRTDRYIEFDKSYFGSTIDTSNGHDDFKSLVCYPFDITQRRSPVYLLNNSFRYEGNVNNDTQIMKWDLGSGFKYNVNGNNDVYKYIADGSYIVLMPGGENSDESGTTESGSTTTSIQTLYYKDASGTYQSIRFNDPIDFVYESTNRKITLKLIDNRLTCFEKVNWTEITNTDDSTEILIPEHAYNVYDENGNILTTSLPSNSNVVYPSLNTGLDNPYTGNYAAYDQIGNKFYRKGVEDTLVDSSRNTYKLDFGGSESKMYVDIFNFERIAFNNKGDDGLPPFVEIYFKRDSQNENAYNVFWKDENEAYHQIFKPDRDKSPLHYSDIVIKDFHKIIPESFVLDNENILLKESDGRKILYYLDTELGYSTLKDNSANQITKSIGLQEKYIVSESYLKSADTKRYLYKKVELEDNSVQYTLQPESDFKNYELKNNDKIRWDNNGYLYIETTESQSQTKTIQLYYSVSDENGTSYEKAKFINKSTSESINLSETVSSETAATGKPYGIYLSDLGNYKIVNPNNNAPYLIINNGEDNYLPIVNTQERIEFIYQLSSSTELYYRNWENPSGELITLVDIENDYVNFKVVIQYVSYLFRYYRPKLLINEGDPSNPKEFTISSSYFGTKADISKLPQNDTDKIDPKNKFIKIGTKYYILSMIRNNFVLIDRDEKILTLDNVVTDTTDNYVNISENSEIQYKIIAPFILYNGDPERRIDFDIGNGNLSAFAVLDSVKSYMYIYPNNPTYYDPEKTYTLTEGGEISGNNLKSKLYVPNVYSNAISISPCTDKGKIIKRIDEYNNNFAYMLPIEMQNKYTLTTTDWKNYKYAKEGSDAKIELVQDVTSGLCSGDFDNLVPSDDDNSKIYVSSGKLKESDEIKWTSDTAEGVVCKAGEKGIEIENKYTNDTKLFVHVINNTININCSESGDVTAGSYKSFTIDFDNRKQESDNEVVKDKYIIWEDGKELAELNGKTNSFSTNNSKSINIYHEQLTECAYDDNSVYTAYYLYYFGKTNSVHDIISIGSNTYDIERQQYTIVENVKYIANGNKITIADVEYEFDDETPHVDIDRKPYIIHSRDDANTNNYIIVNGETIFENNGYYIYNFSSYQQSINSLIKKGEEYYIVFDGFIFKDSNGIYNEMNDMYMYAANGKTYIPKYVDSVKFDGIEYKILKNNYESMVISNSYAVISGKSGTIEINNNIYTYSVSYDNSNITLSSSESTDKTFSINDESVTIVINNNNYKYYIFVDQHNNVVLAENYYNISDGLNTISNKQYYIAFDSYSRIIDVSNECTVVDKNTITYDDECIEKNSTPVEFGNWEISYNSSSSEWTINKSNNKPSSWIRYFEYNPHTSKLSNVNYINQNQTISRDKIIPFKQNISDYGNEPTRYNMYIRNTDYIYAISFDDSTIYNEKSKITPLSFNTYKYTNPRSENITKPDSEKDSISYPVWNDEDKQYYNQVYQIESIKTNDKGISLSVIDKNTDTPAEKINRFYVGDEKTYIYIYSTKFHDTFDLSTYSLSLTNDTLPSQPFKSIKSINLLPGTVNPVTFDIIITKTTNSFLTLDLETEVETDDSTETITINVINEDHKITSLNNISLFHIIQYGTNKYLYYIQMIQNELYMTELSTARTNYYDSPKFTVSYDNKDFIFTIEDDSVKYRDTAVAKLGDYFTIDTDEKTYYFQITVNEHNSNEYIVNIYNVKGRPSIWQWYIMINELMYEIYIDNESYYLSDNGILFYPKEDESYQIEQNQDPKLYIAFENEIGSYYYEDLDKDELIKKNSTIRRTVNMNPKVTTESTTTTTNICPNLYPFIVDVIEKQYTSPVENIVDVNRVFSDIVSNISETHKYIYSSGELYDVIYYKEVNTDNTDNVVKDGYTFKQSGVIVNQNGGSAYIGDTFCKFSLDQNNENIINITYDKSVQTNHGHFILTNDNQSITYYIYGMNNVAQFGTSHPIKEDGTVVIGDENVYTKECKVVYNDSQKYVSYDWNEQVDNKNNTVKLQDGEYEISAPKFRVYRETALSTYIQYSESSGNNDDYVTFGYGDNVVYNYISDTDNGTYEFGTINYKGKIIYPYTLKYNESNTNEYTINSELYTAYINTAAQMKINETTYIELLGNLNQCQIGSDEEKYNIQYSNNTFNVKWSINEKVIQMYNANITYYSSNATAGSYKKITYIDRNDYWYDGKVITSGGDNYLKKYDITVTSNADVNITSTWSNGILTTEPSEASIPVIKVDYGLWKQGTDSSSTMFAYRLITINVDIESSNKTFNILAFGPIVINGSISYYIIPVTRSSNTETEKSFSNPGKDILCLNGTFYITTGGKIVSSIEDPGDTVAYTCNISLTNYSNSDSKLKHIVPDNFPNNNNRIDIIKHSDLVGEGKSYQSESDLSKAMYERCYSTDGPISTNLMEKITWGKDYNGFSISYSESVNLKLTTNAKEFTFKSNLDNTYPAESSNRTVYIYTALKSVDTYGNIYISNINNTFTINGYTATWTPDYPYNITTKYSYTRGTKKYDLIRYGDYVELSDGNYYTIIQNVNNNTIYINNTVYNILYSTDGIHLNNTETDITLEQYSQKTALGETGYSYVYTNHRYEIYDQSSNKTDTISPTFYRLIRNNQRYYVYLSEPVTINTFEYTFYIYDSLLSVYFVKVAQIDVNNMVTLLDGTIHKALYAVIVNNTNQPTHLIKCDTIKTENGQFKINNTTYTITPSNNEYLVSYNTSETYNTSSTESFNINGIHIQCTKSKNISDSSLYFTITSETAPTKTYTKDGYIRFGVYYMYYIIDGVMYLSIDGSNISYTFRNNDYGVSIEDNLMNKYTCNNIVINAAIIDNITKTTILTVGTCTYDLSLITTLKNDSTFTIADNNPKNSNNPSTFTYDVISGNIQYNQSIDLSKFNIFNDPYPDSFKIYFKSRVNYDLKITNSLDSTKYYYSYNNLYGNINTDSTIASVNFPCPYSFNISYNEDNLTCTLITYNEIHLIRKTESLSMNVKFKSTEKSISLNGINSLTEPLIGKPENTYCIKYTAGENKNITCQNPKMNFYIKTESLKTNAILPLFLIEKKTPNNSRAVIYSKTYIYNSDIKQATYNSSANKTATIKLNTLSTENQQKYLISGTLKLTYDDDPFNGYLVGGLSEKNLNSIISENKSLGVGIGSCTYEYITYNNLKYLYLEKVAITGGYIRYDDGDTITEITPKASSYDNLIPSVNERTISHIPIKSIESITPNVSDQICLFEAADVYVYSSLIVNTTSRSVRIINDDEETYIIQKSDDDDNKYIFINSLNDHYYYESDENILKSQIYKAFIKPSNSILYKYWTRNQYILSVLNSSLNISSPKLVLSDICDVTDSNPLRVDYYTSDGSIIYTFVDDQQEITNLNDSYYIYPDKITDIDGNKLDMNILDISRHKYTIYELNNPATLEETADIEIQGKYLTNSLLEKDMFTISENSKFPISSYSSHENYDIISFMSSDVITVINNLNSQLGGDAENYIVNCNGVNYVAIIVNDKDNEKYIMYAPQNAENKFIVTKFGNKIDIENININDYIYKQHTEVKDDTYLITLSLNGLSVVLSNPVNDNTAEVSIYLSNNKSIKSVSFSETINLNDLSMKSSEYTISGTIMSGEYIYADKYSLLIEWENFYNYDNEANVVRNSLYIHGIQLAYNEDDRIRISIDNNTTYLQYVQTPVYCNVPGKYYELQRDDLFKINVSKNKFYKTYPYIRYKQDSFVYPAIKDINNEYIMTISQNAYNSSMSNVYVRSINNISIPNGVNANICNNINPYTTYLSENISDRLIGVGGIFKGNKVISEMAMTSLKGYILPYTGKMQMTVEFN